MAFWAKLRFWRQPTEQPEHLYHGRIGEAAAKKYLCQKGLKFLTANFSGKRGEIDLIFRDGQCLVFVEVKTRTEGGWTRPSKAVDLAKKRALARTASDYLRALADPRVPYRFDVVEVILQGGTVCEIRHIENGFNTQGIWRRRP